MFFPPKRLCVASPSPTPPQPLLPAGLPSTLGRLLQKRRACPSEPYEPDLWGGGGSSHSKPSVFSPRQLLCNWTPPSAGQGVCTGRRLRHGPVLQGAHTQRGCDHQISSAGPEGRAKTPSVAHEGTERDGLWLRRESLSWQTKAEKAGREDLA